MNNNLETKALVSENTDISMYDKVSYMLDVIDNCLQYDPTQPKSIDISDNAKYVFHNTAYLLSETDNEELNKDLTRRLLLAISNLKKFQQDQTEKHYFTTDGLITFLEKAIAQSLVNVK